MVIIGMTMENVGEISDQQQLVESTASGSANVGSPSAVSSVVSAASVSAVDNVNTGSEAHVSTQHHTDLISPSQVSGLSTITSEQETSPHHIQQVDSTTQSQADTSLAVTVANMMESTVDFRSPHNLGDSIYAPMNGRMSPGLYGSTQSMVNSTYATLTPLQPLPPISTVSEKFAAAAAAASPNVSGSFTLMQNQPLNGIDNSFRYDKLGNNMGSMNMGGGLSSSVMPIMPSNGYGSQSQAGLGNVSIPSPYTSSMYTNHSELHSPKQESKMVTSPNSYEPYHRVIPTVPSTRLHSPNPMMPTTLNGLHPAHTPSPHSQLSHMAVRDRQPMSPDSQGGSKHELEEINTKELAQKISSELKRYSIPQAVFAQRVLCRSQGTLSDLLRNPKPWSKLKSGRETFRRMWKWLQEPEFQRMSALRLAGNFFFTYFTLL